MRAGTSGGAARGPAFAGRAVERAGRALSRAGRTLGLAALGLAIAGAAAAQEAGQEYPVEPPPPLDRPVDVEFPEVARDTLDNGLELVVVENHEQPVVSVRLYVPAGEATSPPSRAGLAMLAANLLDAGTESLTAEQIASRIEGVGADLATGAGNDYAFVRATTLTEHLPLVVDILGEVVRKPTFPADEFDTEKKRTLSGLRVELSQPGPLATRRFLAEVYDDHPYGDEPTLESVSAVTREDVVGFHTERYTPERALLVVAGDIDRERARELATRTFGDWTGEAPSTVDMPTPVPPESTRIHLVHRPGSVQTNLWAGNLAVRPGNEDAHALAVMNRILGGGTNARLFLILREDKGWTYGAYSQITEPKDLGYFAARTEVRTPVTDSALVELVEQIRRMQREPVSEEELREAKQYIAGHFPLEIETPEQVAGQVADVLLRGLGIDYIESYRSQVADVGVEDVQRVARRHLQPDSMVIVAVGDAERILEPLQATGIGPITVYDTEGREIDPADLGVKRSDVALDASRIRSGTFTYAFSFQGNRMGEYTLSLQETAEGWRGQESLQGPLSQQAGYTFTGELEPVSATQEVQQGPLTITSDLTYDGSHVTGTATVPKGPPQQGQMPELEDVTVDTTLVEGVIDQNMALAAVLAAPLDSGATFSLPIYSPATGVSQLQAEVTGTETLEVPAGTFETWRVELSTGQANLTLWVTREAPRLLVKQEFAGQPITVELESVGEAEPSGGSSGSEGSGTPRGSGASGG